MGTSTSNGERRTSRLISTFLDAASRIPTLSVLGENLLPKPISPSAVIVQADLPELDVAEPSILTALATTFRLIQYEITPEIKTRLEVRRSNFQIVKKTESLKIQSATDFLISGRRPHLRVLNTDISDKEKAASRLYSSLERFTSDFGGEISSSCLLDGTVEYLLRIPSKESSEINLETFPSGNNCILVVEDDTHVREMVSTALEMKGYKVLAAKSAEEALASILKTKIECAIAIIDLILPGMNGIELIKKLRKESPGLPCIITSGHAAALEEYSKKKTHGVTFVSKPYPLPQLFETLNGFQLASPRQIS